MEHLGYYNGKYGQLQEMMIPMLDRACYFGDGVYDAACTRNHIIFALDEHLDRMYNGASLLRIDIPYSKQELAEILIDMSQKVDDGEQLVYFQISRGTGYRSHVFPDKSAKPSLLIMISPFKRFNLSEAVAVITVEDTRYLHCNIKTLNLIPNVMAAQRAKENECYEVIFHRNNRVTECSHSNVHIIKDGILKTAPTDSLILPGIERKHLLEVCSDLQIPYSEVPYTIKELMEADEVLITSTGCFGVRVLSIDHIGVGGHSETLLNKIQSSLTQRFIVATNK